MRRSVYNHEKVNRWVKLSVLSGTLVAGLLGASQATYADSYNSNSSGNLDLNAGLRLNWDHCYRDNVTLVTGILAAMGVPLTQAVH